VSIPVNILSPHFDDAAYGLTLTISRLIGNFVPVTLINCFTKTKWTAIPVDEKQVSDVSKLRANEDLEFNSLFNSAIKIINLDLLDAPLRRGYIFKHKPLEADEWKIVSELSLTLKELVNGILFSPLGIGNHIDHEICLEAVLQLPKDIPVIFYEDLPYTARITRNETWRHVQKLEERLQVKLDNHIQKLNSCTINKEGAIRVYKSQINEEICGEILSYMNLLEGERCWGESKALDSLKNILAC
jgi:LmbE family N-acetylglucosaminyl deacetylase